MVGERDGEFRGRIGVVLAVYWRSEWWRKRIAFATPTPPLLDSGEKNPLDVSWVVDIMFSMSL